MTEISFDDLVTGLRGWARGRAAHEQAAVELLIWHETWLRRPDFKDAAINQMAAGFVARVYWDEAREFIDRGYFGRDATRPLPASSNERAILGLAVALGEDQFRIVGMGTVHRWHAADAFAAACGQTLVLPIPEPGHGHPDFIPGGNDARLWVCLADVFRDAGVPRDAALLHARTAVAIVRRERAKTTARTFAPGDEIPLDVTRAYDLDGDIWERQSADPDSTLRDTWKMPGFDPERHEDACGGAWITPWLLDRYGPLTEVPGA